MPRVKILSIALICGLLFGCLSATKELSLAELERPETGVFGLVTAAAKETAGNLWVYAYRSQQGGFRGPADFASRVEGDGSYLLDLLPGRWYLVARSRPQGPLTGPPQTGDAWAVYQQNPITLNVGDVQRIDLQLQPVAATMLLRGGALSHSDTGFTGVLVGPENRPVAGAIALAYQDADFRRMPDHSSAQVAADGRFTLFVTAAGRYCLVARQGTRGQPIQGELYGLLGKGDSGCRNVADGEILDVGEIHLRPYMR